VEGAVSRGRPPFIVRSADVPEEEGHYAPPFDIERLSWGRNLGKAAGSVKVGLWQERIPPGRRTSFTHAHSHAEELVYVLGGQCALRLVEPGTAPRDVPVAAGDVISFPPGTGIAHCFANRGEGDCTLLCFGERLPDLDRAFYPEDEGWDAHLKRTHPERHWSSTERAPTGIQLETERLRITTLGPEDARRVARFYEENQAHLSPFAPPRPSGFCTEPYWALRLIQARRELATGQAIHLFLTRKDDPDSRVIGTVTLSPIVRGPLQSANLGYDLDRHHQGRGLMTEAVRRVVQYAFEDLALHRLAAGYVPHNVRSAKLLRGLGFVVEGHARSFLFVGGAWQDHVQTGLVNPRSD
jgi:ribosomal-protein-alanine N-acetyltransferase